MRDGYVVVSRMWLQTLGGVVGFNRFALYQHGRVPALDVLAGGCHGAGDVAGAYQRTTGNNAQQPCKNHK